MGSAEKTAIIVGLIGVLGNIIVALIPYIAKIIRRLSERVNIKIGMAILFSFMILMSGGYLSWAYISKINLQIIDPVQYSLVQEIETVKCKARNIPKNERVWVVIYSYADQTYYPSHKYATNDKNGDWVSTDIDIGTNVDQGKQFDIIALLADQTIQQFFQTAFANPEYAGLSELPKGDGKRLFHKITVVRQ